MTAGSHSRREITDHQAILSAIRSVGALEELVEYEPNQGFRFGVDLEVCVYGRNYGPGKKVGPYIRLFTYPPCMTVIRQGDWDTNTLYIVVDGMAEVFNEGNLTPVAVFAKGRPFGEWAVLAGVRRIFTVRAHHETGLMALEIQRPAIRMLRKLQKFAAALDLSYRTNGRHFAAQALSVSATLKQKISDLMEFRVMAKGHVVCREGTQITHFVMIKDGWIKRTGHNAKGVEVTDIIGPGFFLGLNVFTYPDARWPYRITALSRLEVIEIPVPPVLADPALMEDFKREFARYGAVGTPLQPEERLDFTPSVKIAQEQVLDTGLADTNNLLLMDMDLCIRCGNCSRACHHMHGHTRLVRRGIHLTRSLVQPRQELFQNLLAPSVCLHCKDPECLTGCPTGAIARFGGGEVDILPKLCIGCGDCATQCPYHAITLVPRTGPNPQQAADKPAFSLPLLLKKSGLVSDERPAPVTDDQDLVAIKCNLCTNTDMNPTDEKGRPIHSEPAYSCEENCPTGALIRIHPQSYFNEVSAITGQVFRREGSIWTGRAFGNTDPKLFRSHYLGLALTVLCTVLTTWGIVTNGLGVPLFSIPGLTWINFRWITGIVGLLGIAVVMTYPVRRQIWKRRAGQLRYWMLLHAYAGVIAGILLLLHGGTDTGGWVTSALMISFDGVILTGLWGLLVYQLGPRLLTKIEGEPLLAEDLAQRREELFQQIADLVTTASEKAKLYQRETEFAETFLVARDAVLKTTTSLNFLFRQYLKREPLDELINATQWLFREETKMFKDPEEKRLFRELIQAAVVARRIDALIYIHQALKIWLTPHVLTTSLMLVLLLIHIVQVVYFVWR